MVQAILILLGLFVVFGVTLNILAIRKRLPNLSKNTLFKSDTKISVMQPAVNESPLEPVIDESAKQVAPEPEKTAAPEASTLVAMHVMKASSGDIFSPYELIQSLADLNCHFGEMGIFHRHEQRDGSGKILFSIAQAVKPGVFHLDDIGSLQCPGLVLFMDAAMMDDPHLVFNLMLETAEQLCGDLNAALYQTPTQPMSHASQTYYEQQLSHAKQERNRLKEMA